MFFSTTLSKECFKRALLSTVDRKCEECDHYESYYPYIRHIYGRLLTYKYRRLNGNCFASVQLQKWNREQNILTLTSTYIHVYWKYSHSINNKLILMLLQNQTKSSLFLWIKPKAGRGWKYWIKMHWIYF